MDANNLQIYWHESQPVYGVCFRGEDGLFTAGGDNKVRMWRLNFGGASRRKVETIDFLASLTLHEQAVNVIRFDHRGEVLASAGDDGQVLLWRLEEKSANNITGFGDDAGASEEAGSGEDKEWVVWKRIRSNAVNNEVVSGPSEVYDVCWSPDDKYIVTASIDNSVKVFNVSNGNCVAYVKDHNHYVQGVTWDPQNEFIVSQSVDRSINVYEIQFNTPAELKAMPNLDRIRRLRLRNRVVKGELPQISAGSDGSVLVNHSVLKTSYLFHNETLPSFFRRLVMSPCGSLLVVPTGIFKSTQADVAESQSSSANPEVNNAIYIYTRASLKQAHNKPDVCLPFLNKPAIAVAFNQNYYKLQAEKPYIDLPYKLVFAVATTNQVLFYDTESPEPISIVSNLHYTPLTDIAWSAKGDMVMVSSTDGFCSAISIDSTLFGEQIDRPASVKEVKTEDEEPKRKLDIVNILPVRKKAKEVK
ncbi:Chromatin assembly factor 1 subunit p60 [Nakaseomyces bracarensis]|uniref:Chromatin assembly factor 1 subunit p60 n=1 Tax=Nakaseomyces bracarensis TaxID=273131 RepID=A0ABR4P136_9SACH